jgi:hypothetical protein
MPSVYKYDPQYATEAVIAGNHQSLALPPELLANHLAT